jgi:hypothetical protein
MIAFYAQGGLGNQLFQYAAAKQWAQELDCELVVDQSWFQRPLATETPRPYELSRYPLSLRCATEQEQRRWRWMHGRLARFASPLMPMRLVVESSQLSPVVTAGSYLKGYWQSQDYFKSSRVQLLRELQPKSPPSDLDQQVLAQISSCNAVSIHVRRGDYVSLSSAAAFHGLCSIDYYQQSIDYMLSHVTEPRFFVFSDDPAWSKANLPLPQNSYYVAHNKAETAFQDLRLMQHCRHHIIANSSFSWWGAWLASAEQQLVLAPKQWFAAQQTPDNLIPANWRQL